MGEAEVIDLGVDPVAERRAARRRLSRVIAPIVAAALLILSIIGLVVAGYESNRRGALALSADVLAGLEKRIELRTNNWLGASERALLLLDSVFADGPLASATREDAERLAINLLRHVPSIALVSLADMRGNYVLKRRNEGGSVDTKTIRNDPPPREVTWVRRDANDAVIAIEEDPEDQFDPRTRPWFVAAVAAEGVVWTDPYIFFTDRVPGVTAAVAFRRAGEIRAVFGVDIRLDALGQFLASLEIGKRGQAIIVDSAGLIVAHPDPGRAIREQGTTLVRTRIDDIGDPVLTRAYGLHRVNGSGRFTIEVGDERHIVIWSPMREVGDGSWSILITVPESDFVGFVATTGRITTGVGLLVALMALGLAVFLVRQGLRADGMERTLERRTQVMAAQAQAMSRLGRSPAVHDPTRDEGLELLTATLAHTLEARRASIWRLGAIDGALRCEDLFDATAETHVRGMRLPRQQHVRLIEALGRGDVFEVAAASADPRTQELATSLLAEAGTRAVLCVPAMRGPTLIGALLLEDRETDVVPLAEAAAFSLAIAGIAVARMTAAETARRTADAMALGEARRSTANVAAVASLPAPPAVPRLGDGTLAREPAEAGGTPPAARPLAEPGLAAELFPAVTVLVLRLTDADVLAEAIEDEAAGRPRCTLADRAVRLAQDCAASHGIAYVRVMGSAVMLADGFGDRAEAAPSALALLALDLAERCTGLFAALDRQPGFGIGIDTAPVIGAAVGSGTRTYNIWGEAVRGADEMAETAPRGTVQVTEALQRRIAEGFIFRPRGRFWRSGPGETGTFLLTDQA
jgi:class 3 adenylate cyclase